jgi:hypothetical protein
MASSVPSGENRVSPLTGKVRIKVPSETRHTAGTLSQLAEMSASSTEKLMAMNGPKRNGPDKSRTSVQFETFHEQLAIGRVSDGIDGVAMSAPGPDDVRTALREGDGRERSQQDRREHTPATKTILAQGFHGLFRFHIHSLVQEHVKDIRMRCQVERTPGRRKNEIPVTAHRLARCGILRTNGKRTKRRASDSNDCHAQGYQSERRYFWRMVDLANGSRQRNSRGQNRASASCYCRDGRNVVSRTRAGRGHRQVLCASGENRSDIDDDSGGGLGNAIHDRRAAPRHTRRLYTRRRR